MAVQVYIPMNKKGFPTAVFLFFETESCVALELQVCSTTPNLAFVFLIALFTRVGCNHYISICISLLAKDIKLFKILLCPCVYFKDCVQFVGTFIGWQYVRVCHSSLYTGY